MANYNELQNIFMKEDGKDFLEYEELNNVSGFKNIWTSSSKSGANARYINNNGGGGDLDKTLTGLVFYIVRLANISEL